MIPFNQQRRCYDGCFDSGLQAIINHEQELLTKVKQFNPEACCTFHHEIGWQVHIWGKPITGFYQNKIDALLTAIQRKGVIK